MNVNAAGSGFGVDDFFGAFDGLGESSAAGAVAPGRGVSPGRAGSAERARARARASSRTAPYDGDSADDAPVGGFTADGRPQLEPATPGSEGVWHQSADALHPEGWVEPTTYGLPVPAGALPDEPMRVPRDLAGDRIALAEDGSVAGPDGAGTGALPPGVADSLPAGVLQRWQRARDVLGSSKLPADVADGLVARARQLLSDAYQT
ncbi:hypothetical protein, partial [Amycolatopsis sp. NPDC051061]|uniref:hypothetical protein n=1 Tax=Amycolatopsis sp. NPDC051061 TaxID=3155042 RepID=UPI00341D6C69